MVVKVELWSWKWNYGGDDGGGGGRWWNCSDGGGSNIIVQEERGKLKQRRWTGIQIKEEKKGDRSELGGG